jgi:hypothetical protein
MIQNLPQKNTSGPWVNSPNTGFLPDPLLDHALRQFDQESRWLPSPIQPPSCQSWAEALICFSGHGSPNPACVFPSLGPFSAAWPPLSSPAQSLALGKVLSQNGVSSDWWEDMSHMWSEAFEGAGRKG